MRVDIVVLTRNSGERLSRLGPALTSQRGRHQPRVIVIDSGSTDDTCERVRVFAERIERIRPEEFDHGATRDLGARLAESEFVVFLSHDSAPAHNEWLDELVKPLEEHPNVAATWSRQIPRPEHPPWVHDATRESPSGAPDERLIKHGVANDGRTRPDRYLGLANTSSAYRRALLLKEPFGRTAFGEDKLWQERMMRRGWDFFYAARSVVEHSHDLPFVENLRRWRSEAQLWRTIRGCGPGGLSRLGCLAMPALGWLFAFKSALRTPVRHWLRLASYHLSASIGHFLGCL